jgi:hypothetical protein
MKKIILTALFLTAGAVHAAGEDGHCDLYDSETGSLISFISFDFGPKLVCTDTECEEATIIVDENKAFVFITKDDSGAMSVYYVPGCWNKDKAIGYLLYSVNNQPDHLMNCNMARDCD